MASGGRRAVLRSVGRMSQVSVAMATASPDPGWVVVCIRSREALDADPAVVLGELELGVDCLSAPKSMCSPPSSIKVATVFQREVAVALLVDAGVVQAVHRVTRHRVKAQRGPEPNERYRWSGLASVPKQGGPVRGSAGPRTMGALVSSTAYAIIGILAVGMPIFLWNQYLRTQDRKNGTRWASSGLLRKSLGYLVAAQGAENAP
jgi:hypothetical protein